MLLGRCQPNAPPDPNSTTFRRPVAPKPANEGAFAMTETLETSNLLITTRPRAFEALPVLISIPNLATSGRGARPKVRRRRLRREVRVAGYVLLAILPASMALVAFGGERPPTMAAGLTVERRGDSADHSIAPRPTPSISLEPLEPMVVTVHRELEAPVILPGYLLPADTSEESSDGGH
jgi:hypothetical protein